ncbi:MAG: MFS transporter [Alphaproteobacteria bacterium]|nr:MFS transporter [Alphaproteobacteria bacterium]
MTAATAFDDPRRDGKVMALVGVAHFASHFYQLVLPPLFPFLRAEWGITYTALGVVVTTFYVASGLGQFAAGFVVDRIGARRVLLSGMVLLAGSTAAIGLFGSYWLLLPFAVLAGLGNSVFHPADYTILSASIGKSRLGRAYGTHTLGGTLGYAAAPAVVLPLALALGWRGALVAAGLVGLAIAALVAANSGLLRDDRSGENAGAKAAAPLFSAPVLLCFVYFTFFASALIALQTFFTPAVGAIFQVPAAAAGAALTAYFLGNAAGIVAGGIAADRWRRPDAIIGIGLCIAGALLLAAGYVPLGPAALAGLLAAAGGLSGFTSASRDMLVRNAAPPGATGRVFGFVYSALDVGSAIAPLAAGLLLDRGRPDLVFVLLAACLWLAAATVPLVRRLSRA